jgi:C-terminal binding protein
MRNHFATATGMASSRRLQHVRAALQGLATVPTAAGAELPVVAIIDMENKDGTIYSGAGDDTIEMDELEGTATVVYTGAANIEEVDPELLPRLSAVLLRRCPFGAEQLAKLPNLKVILRMGAGYDNVDTEACSAAGVIACNCPDAWVEEVADSTICLMIALIRRTFDLVQMVSAGEGWTRQADLQQKGITRVRCVRLAPSYIQPRASHHPAPPCPLLADASRSSGGRVRSGMRLGIVGMGRIGTAVAQRARAFGFELSFYDPYLSAGAEKGFGGFVRHTSFEDLVANSDVLTFHCPLTETTRGMLNAATLPSSDHPGLFVVNCARGGIAEEDAIIAGLADGRLRGVALDSLSTEPEVSPALLQAQADGAHLLITPHAAFYSDEAFVGALRVSFRYLGHISTPRQRTRQICQLTERVRLKLVQRCEGLRRAKWAGSSQASLRSTR